MKFNPSNPQHPDKATLLAWLDGELSWWRRRAVGRHVRSCWQCKGQTSELEDMVGAVGLSIDQLPEPSRVDTSKAYWRFRETCLQLDPAPAARKMRLKPAWVLAAAAVLATTGLAYVTTQQRFKKSIKPPAPHPVRSALPGTAPQAPVEAARESVKPAPAPAPAMDPQLDDVRVPAWLPGPAEEELLAAEVQAMAALHRPRFCLNSGITVRRVGSAIEISGLVQSRDVRERVTGVLQGIAHPELLRFRLADATGAADTAAAVVEPRPDSGQPPRRAAPPIEAWLRASLKVGSRVTEREMFSLMGAVVLESEAVSSEAWAIRHVAEQFPPDRTRRLNPELSAQLLQMVDDHAIALGNSLRLLQGRLHPVLGAQPEPARNAFIPAPNEPWQEKVLALQQRAEAVVSRLLQSFSSDAGAGNPGAIPDFSAVLSALEGSFKECIAAAGDLRANLQTQARN